MIIEMHGRSTWSGKDIHCMKQIDAGMLSLPAAALQKEDSR